MRSYRFDKIRASFVAFIFIFSLLYFCGLQQTFYQQDEWQTLGLNITNGVRPIFSQGATAALFGETRPLSAIMYLVLLGYFQFTVTPAFIVAIVLHALNTFLVYDLILRLTGKKQIAWLAGLFFAVNSVASQAVTWVSAVGTLPATTFLVLSIRSYLLYFERPQNKYLLYGLLFAVISLLFKGVGMFLFILLPLMFVIYKRPSFRLRDSADLIRKNAVLFGVGAAMVLVRLSSLFTASPAAGYTQAAGNSKIALTLAYRAVLYPLTALFQLFIPPLNLYEKTQMFARLQYMFLATSPVVDLVAQSVIADMFALVGSLGIIICLIALVFKARNGKVTKNITFALSFLFLSMLPYFFLNRDGSYFSGRYYYVSVIPVSMIFGYILEFFINKRPWGRTFGIMFILVLCMTHIHATWTGIAHQREMANYRKILLSGIKEDYPNPAKDSIFYVTSDRNFLGEITNPFQSGLGYVLEVWYYNSGNIPKSFITDNWLWDLGTEGYKKEGEYGFGYFQDMDKMAQVFRSGDVSPDIIRAYYFDTKAGIVRAVHAEVRSKMATFSAMAL